jgi:hypothetical protein
VVKQPVELSSDISAFGGISTNLGDNSVEKAGRGRPKISQSGRS